MNKLQNLLNFRGCVGIYQHSHCDIRAQKRGLCAELEGEEIQPMYMEKETPI